MNKHERSDMKRSHQNHHDGVKPEGRVIEMYTIIVKA